jgi:PAS domain S-box-containing protein
MVGLALDKVPMCGVVLDRDDKAVTINEMFATVMGPLFKYANYPFTQAACAPVGKSDLQAAVTAVRAGAADGERLRNVEMLTLAGDSGIPVKAHFDWFIWRGNDEGTVILMGDPCSGDLVERRAKDSELVDFFQNAPIALHWLSSTGHVMWANQTELDTLGYTAEEYIGQPIIKFCPDEADLLPEILSTLDSGKIIKDVPVRFRSKAGKIVPLLVDSNVAYTVDESGKKVFNHTRCFIRDDTARRVRQARGEAKLREARRTQQLFDAYVSRTLHLVATPCHVVQQSLDLALAKMDDLSKKLDPVVAHETASICQLISDSANQIVGLRELVADAGDAMRFEQGVVLETIPTPLSLREACHSALQRISGKVQDGVEIICEHDAGANVCNIDGIVLDRVLDQLLGGAAEQTPPTGVIRLSVTHVTEPSGARVRFEICNRGPDLPSLHNVFKLGFRTMAGAYADEPTDLEAHGPEAEAAIDAAEAERQTLAQQLSYNTQVNGFKVGFCLSYGLVRSLGGELRASSTPGETLFYFSLPAVKATADAAAESYTIKPGDGSATNSAAVATGLPIGPISLSRSASPPLPRPSRTLSLSAQSVKAQAEPSLSIMGATNFDVANRGLKALDSPHVLVVEDTPTAANILCMLLKRLGCSTDRAENGQLAVDMLRGSAEGLYDLVLMDLRMPVMDGFEATRIIKEEKLTEALVVALTAEDSSDVRTRCADLGFDGFYSKPMSLAVLTKMMADKLGLKQK